MDNTQVYFAGNDLSGIVGASLKNHNFNDYPTRNLQVYKLARANKSVVTSAEFSVKQGTVNFVLYGCDREEAEEILQNLKSYLRPVNETLKVLQGGEEITYDDATLNEIDYTWFSTKIVLTLVFTLANPVGYQDVSTVMLNETITSSTDTSDIQNDGSMDALPVISIDVNTVTGATDQSITVKNGETGQGITITRTWANGDTVEIDSEAMTVIVNGALSDFSGIFPVFPPGSSPISYVDTFATRNVDIAVTYKKRRI